MLRPGFAMLALSLAVGAAFAQSDRDFDGTPWPEDCNDGFAGAEPGDAEYCDGFDNSCDGAVDPGCQVGCASPEVRWEERLAGSGSPREVSLARSARGYELVWTDDSAGNPEIYWAGLDRWGRTLDPVRRVSAESAVSEQPVVASPGDWRVVFWVDERDGRKEIYFARLTDGGAGTPPASRITISPDDDIEPAAVWSGRFWGLAYTEGRSGRYQVHIASVSDLGALNIDRTVSPKPDEARRPAIAFDGAEYAVVWDDDRHGDPEIYFSAHALDLMPSTGEIRLTQSAGAATHAAIAWLGDRYAVAWQDTRHGAPEIYLAMVDSDGTVLVPEFRLTDDPAVSSEPSLAWAGGELLVAWTDAATGDPAPHYARVAADGTIVAGAAALQPATAGLAEVRIAWDGEAPLSAHVESGAQEVVARKLGCCGDADGDGFDRCSADCDDGRDRIAPGQPEICNGIDDNCDGTIDEGCNTTCHGPDRVTPAESHDSGNASRIEDTALAWDGQGTLALVWGEEDATTGDEQAWFRLIEPDGTPRTGPLALGAGETREPAVAATPDGWLAIFAERQSSSNQRLVAQPLDAAGQPGSPVALDPHGAGYLDDPEIVWDGAGFGLVYESNSFNEDPGGTAYFMRLTRDGRPIGPRESLGGTTDDPRVAWSGDEYAVLTHEPSGQFDGVYVTRFDALGRRIDGPKFAGDANFGATHEGDIAWAGDRYGIVFIDNHEIIYFRTLDANADPLGNERVIVDTDYHWLDQLNLVWNGEEFTVQWSDNDDDVVRAQRFSIEGVKRGGTFVLSGSDGQDASVSTNRRNGFEHTGTALLSSYRRMFTPELAARTHRAECCPAIDGDLDGSCIADCDPFDPDVHPYAPELCDGKDNDCDGDMSGDPPFSVITGLTFSDGDTLQWDASAEPARVYDVQRGSLDTLRATGGDYRQIIEDCMADDLVATQFSDAATPLAGTGWIYLVGSGSTRCRATFESGGPRQVDLRDHEIEQSPDPCP